MSTIGTITVSAEKYEKYKLDSEILQQVLENLDIVIEDLTKPERSDSERATGKEYLKAKLVLVEEMKEALELIILKNGK